MLPVYLGKSLMQNESSHIFRGAGNCFERIVIETKFSIDNSTTFESVAADVTISLEEPFSALCMEHFVIGTAF